MDREEPRRFLATWFFWVDCLFVVATLVDFVEKRRRNRPPLPDARIWFVHVWFVRRWRVHDELARIGNGRSAEAGYGGACLTRQRVRAYRDEESSFRSSPEETWDTTFRYGWPLAVSLGRGWSILWRFKRAQTLRVA